MDDRGVKSAPGRCRWLPGRTRGQGIQQERLLGPGVFARAW